MTPVISPWLFYLMPICQNVAELAFLIAILSGLAVLFLAIGFIANDFDECDKEEANKFKYHLKKITAIFVVSTILTCFIPSEETLTKMIVAQNVTVERVEVVSDTVVTVYNDIMNLFGAANG